jgi:hypothetical protein
MSKADKRNKFLAVFERIREELVIHMKSEKMPEDAVTWFNEVTDFRFVQFVSGIDVPACTRTCCTMFPEESSTAVYPSSIPLLFFSTAL